jgi:uncharacterized coiled-coil DUF342 family protein
MIFEKNVIESFNRVKSDVVKLWERLEGNTKEHEEMKNKISELERMQSIIIQNVNYLREKLPKNGVILNKESNTLHRENCFFAKNVKEENREFINSLEDIRGKDYRKCTCMST